MIMSGPGGIRARTILATSAVTAGAAGVWYAAGASPRAAAPAAPPVSTTTAPVVRGDVTQRVTVAGTLGYDGGYTVTDQLPPGIVTALARPGAVVTRGRRLFAVSGTPAMLMYGTVPAYRDFAAGMSDGTDVRQLERNLVALGMDPHHAIRIDDRFTWATERAIRRWQAARDRPPAERTGRVPLGQVVFLPRAIRVSRTTAGVGGRLAPGAPVLSATSTAHAIAARVTTDQRYLVHVRDRVQVTLPDGDTVSGRITGIGRVAAGPPPGAPGGEGTPTVPLTVRLRVPRGSADLDAAPVQVAITTEARRRVLMVPVTALLAAPGGGYQVRLPDRRLVRVDPGLFDDAAGTVEINGTGLREGMSVEVPTS